MDKNSYNVLKFYIAHPDEMFPISTAAKWFPNLSPRDLLEISNSLAKNGYLRIISGNLFQITNKGKTYKAVNRSSWISKNIIALLALIVSIFAFVESTISLIISINSN